MAEPEVTVIIPVFNDHRSLEIAIPRSVEILSRITNGFELVIAEDGSTDGSAELVRHYEQQDSHIHLFHSDERLGRGKALTRAIYQSKGKIVCYYDVDLATDMQHLPKLISAIREGADIATGSRLMPGSDIVRTGGREIASRWVNFMLRLFF
jgi:glycosyltransferase involved in cell wall biosynthesis